MRHLPKIIFEDEALLIVDKPAFWLTIPAPDEDKPVLTDYLNDAFRRRGLAVKAHPCHRLDYETSGLVIYAKGKHSQQLIMKQFQAGQVRKKYIALVEGRLVRPEGELKGYLGTGRSGKPSEPAITRYKVTGKYPRFTLVEVEPLTGRTNQIRIQFRKLGYPLVGDRRFGFSRRDSMKFPRTALHAAEISFTHPLTGQPMHFSAPLPDDIAKII